MKNQFARRWQHKWLMVLITALMVGCADQSVDDDAPYAELQELGLDKYLGVDSPEVLSADGTTTIWTWAHDPLGNSPGCLRGGTFRASTRVSAQPSEDLVIFLQGGGACWSDFCLAFDYATEGVPPIDVLDPQLEVNPVRDWNAVYLPYCDGSLFAGDARLDDDGDGEIDRDHRGLRNLSAALTVAQKEFPSPKRILLAGSSGGGFGLFLALPLARMVWPEAQILVMNDAGVGVAKEGNEGFITQLLEEFGVKAMIPSSCKDCFADGHLTELLAWSLERDPSVRIAAFSSTRDYVIANLFLQIEPAQFETSLRAEMAQLEARFPGRFASFITEGTRHTTLLGDISGFTSTGGATAAAIGSFLGSIESTQAEGVRFSDWFLAFIDNAETWVPVVASPK
ncbi:MAG TPA: vtpJ-therm [Myxococcales bacterium]|nr:vtpJ-therm [Myxococcales bacterium]HAN31745.1 vtpJ-therm [Myxococcales bacterium]